MKMKLTEDVQEKYEKRLMLHAQDMQTGTTLKEKHQTFSEKHENYEKILKLGCLKQFRQ